MSDLRSRQREATRDQIIDAVHEVLTEENPATLSMPRVAERAGTSLRTLYRYFPTKEALIDAASETFVVSAEDVGGRIALANLADYLRIQWTQFTHSVAAIRAQHMTPAGRTMRNSRLSRHRAGVATALLEEGVDVTDEEMARLVDLIVALVSSSMYLELVDRLGHDETEASRLAAWTVNAVVEHVKNEGVVAP